MPRWREDLTGISTRKPGNSQWSATTLQNPIKHTLKVDDRREDNDGRNQVHDVGQVLTVESLLERQLLVRPGDEQVDKRNDSALELGTTASVDSRRGESLPHDGLADVGRNEERDTATKTVTFLEQLIEKDYNDGGSQELDNEENADTGAEIGRKAVETSQDEDTGLAEG